MRGMAMAYEVTTFQPSVKCKEGSFGSNNSNEPISVLDSRRSPSPSTSTSTLSSSFGGGGNGGSTTTTTTTTALLGVSDNNHNLQQKWSDSVPLGTGISGSLPNPGVTTDGGRKDEWPELQPIPAEFELQQQRFGAGLEDWESLLSESVASPAQDQTLRWISGDVDDTSLSLQQLLQSNQIDGNAAPTTVLDIPAPPNFTPQNSNFFPFSSPGQKQQIFNPQVIINPPPQPQPQPPPPAPQQIQFHHQGLQKAPVSVQGLQKAPVFHQGLQKAPVFNQSLQKAPVFHQGLQKAPVSDQGLQKAPVFDQGLQKAPVSDQGLRIVPVFDQGNELLLKKQNQQQLLQQKPLMVAGTKQEPQQAAPPPPPHHHHHHHHHQNQLIFDQLFAAAELMLSRNSSHAQGILARLNHQLSSAPAPHKPFQRAAFYFKEALLMQMASLMSNPNRITPTPVNGLFKMGAYKMFSEVSPVIQFMNFTSNQTLLEALGDAENIHIIDFDIGFGAQWASFIQELPMTRKNNNGGGCSLKITAFASPSTHHPIELGLMHENLLQFAQEIGISFELEVVNFDSFDPRSFSVSGKEAVAVNFPIWAASTHLSAIPSILRFIKQLSPRIVVSLDRGCERTDLPFPHYLLQGLQYYEVVLDSIDGANVVSDMSNKIQRFLLQPQIERMVLGKFHTPEPMPHWKTLFTAGGYTPVLLSNFAEAQADCVVKRMQVRGFHVEKRHASLVLCWQNRELMTASAWKC